MRRIFTLLILGFLFASGAGAQSYKFDFTSGKKVKDGYIKITSARPSPIKKKDSGEDTAEIPAAKTAKAEPAPKEKEHKTVAPAPKPAAEPDPEALRERIETIRNSVHVEHPKGKHKTMLTDLDNHTCRWPIGDPKDENFHFCGRKIKIGQTYCEEHAAVAYVKATGKK